MITTLEKALNYFRDKGKSYALTFQLTQPANLHVLADLAKFCRANESTFHPDARIAAMLDGRREVWLHIQKYLNLTEEQIVQLANGNPAAVFERLDK